MRNSDKAEDFPVISSHNKIDLLANYLRKKNAYDRRCYSINIKDMKLEPKMISNSSRSASCKTRKISTAPVSAFKNIILEF
jgi:hypothetical protein